MKRIITLQDISCVGRCSITVALPVISAMGVECGILPTAVLSTHTMFKTFTCKDLSDQIEPISDAWEKEQVTFDGIYTGYLASKGQCRQVCEFFDRFGTPDNLILVDPAMADNGKLYPAFDASFPAAMAEVCGKDITVDKLGPRKLLEKSLDEIFEEKIDPRYNVDSVESKLFGLGSESYVTGSHEFYTNYVAHKKNCIICMDAGHFHPTEVISSKLSSYLVFDQEIMLHVSRPVRWDSDHVTILDDETKAIMEEISRCDAFDKVHIGLDFFDGSINRIAATAIGGRSAKKAILLALLQPEKELRQAEHEGRFTRRLALLEEIKGLPFGLVWDKYCEMCGCDRDDWIRRYE